MKKVLNKVLDWFEEHFNFLIELLAFIGGIFCILFALFLIVIQIINPEFLNELAFEIIILPGVIGFFGVIILFALRITRFMTKNT